MPSRIRRGMRSFILVLARFSLPARFVSTTERLVWLSKYGKWLKVHASSTPSFSDRYSLYNYVCSRIDQLQHVDLLEFGVAGGDSLRWWSNRLADRSVRFVGFDSFDGLPEAWGTKSEGAFDQGGQPPPIYDDRVQFQVGLFQDTLGPFLESYKRASRMVVHLDADLHSSTLYVLSSLASVLESGDVLVFDELGSIAAADHEFRAAHDFFTAYNRPFQVLGTASSHKEVALQLV